jgi:cytochrome b pre-mRNA-processing protein 3
MGFIARLIGRRDETALPLYTAIVAKAREPHWYEAGVPDTVDGRFDMIATTLAFVLLRLEDDPEAAEASARLTERFVDDMDSQLREIGIGDIIVGKHIGKMMGMLGGRLGAYRTALAEGSLGAALVRNLWRGETPESAALTHVEAALLAFRDSLGAVPSETILEGVLP